MLSFLKKISKDETGFAALDYSFTMGLIAISTAIYLEQGYAKEREVDLDLEAEQGGIVAQWFSNYILGSKTTLETDLQAGPRTYTLPNIQTAGFAPTAATNLSFFGKSYSVVIARIAPLQFKYIMFATGGEALSDRDLTRVSRGLGAYGGAVFSKADTEFNSVRKFVTDDLSDFAGATDLPSKGDYGVYGEFNIAEIVPDYVSKSRTAGGANQMNVAFNMGNNPIEAVSEIRTSGIAAGNGIGDSEINTLNNLDTTTTTGIAASDGTPETLIQLDANGRAMVQDPIEGKQIANRDFVLANVGSSGSSGWRPFANYQQIPYNPSQNGSNYNTNFAQGIAGERLVRCSIYPSIMMDPNSGSDPWIRISAYVNGGAQSYVLFQHRLLAWQTSYGRNTGTGIDSVDIHDLKLLEGEYLQLSWQGNSVDNNGIYAYAYCSYEVQP